MNKTGKPEHSYNCIQDEETAAAAGGAEAGADGAPAASRHVDGCRVRNYL